MSLEETDEDELSPEELASSLKALPLIKLVFAGSIVVYIALSIYIKYGLFEGEPRGFVYNMTDPVMQILFYIFCVAALLAFAAQFYVPVLMRGRDSSVLGQLQANMSRIFLCELIAMLGLIYFFLGGDLLKGLPFMLFALLALLFGDRQAQKAL